MKFQNFANHFPGYGRATVVYKLVPAQYPAHGMLAVPIFKGG